MIARELLAAGDFTLIRAELVRALDGDATAALVLTRIHWRQTREADGEWWRGTRAQLADETGLSSDQVKRSLGKLKSAGHLDVRQERLGGVWDHTASYRVALSESAHVAESPDGRAESPADWADSPNLDRAESPNLPVTKTRSTKTNTSDVAAATTFSRFWDVYPRKVGKREAERKYAIAVRTVDPELIIDRAVRYAAARRGQPVEYTKHPATWLHQGCWDDAPAANGRDRYEDKDPDWAPWL